MAEITACPACTKQNRVPSAATGKPTCGACGGALPWVVDATDTTFDDAVATAVPVLVDLWAPWCGPCRMVTPILEDLARQRAGQLKIVKVNVEDSPQIAAASPAPHTSSSTAPRSSALASTSNARASTSTSTSATPSSTGSSTARSSDVTGPHRRTARR